MSSICKAEIAETNNIDKAGLRRTQHQCSSQAVMPIYLGSKARAIVLTHQTTMRSGNRRTGFEGSRIGKNLNSGDLIPSMTTPACYCIISDAHGHWAESYFSRSTAYLMGRICMKEVCSHR